MAEFPQDHDDKGLLELEQLRLQNQKLKQELSPVGRWLSVASPFVGMFAAITAIAISLWTQHNQNVEQSRANQQRLLAAALESIAAKDSPGRQLSGIYQLSALWRAREDEEVIGAALVGMLTAGGPANRDTRCAAALAIGAAVTQEDIANGDHDRVRRLSSLFFGRGDTGQWGLVAHENFLLRHIEEPDTMPTTSTQGTFACETPLDATKEAIRKSWRYLQNANLQGTDLSRAPLYEADLGSATLARAELGKVTLRCANLAHADLEGVTFSGKPDLRFVNLKGARGAEALVEIAKSAQAPVLHLENEQWREWAASSFSGAVLLRLSAGSPTESEIAAAAGGSIENVRSLCPNG